MIESKQILEWIKEGEQIEKMHYMLIFKNNITNSYYHLYYEDQETYAEVISHQQDFCVPRLVIKL